MSGARIEARVRFLAVAAGVLFGVLGLRLWFLQVVTASSARAAALDNAVRLVPIEAPRGRMLDRAGRVLVGNRVTLEVTINRQELAGDVERVLLDLSRVLDVPIETLADRLDTDLYYSYSPVPVASGVTREQAFWIEEHRHELPGVEVAKIPTRAYAGDDALAAYAAHVVGYLGEISPEQLDEPRYASYRSGDEVGQSGLEATYEGDLRGTPGYVSYRVDAMGRNLGELGQRDPVPGSDLRLTIDLEAQRVAEQSLALGIDHARTVFDLYSGKKLKATGGAVIVIDPGTGAVRALASFPTYDPGIFTEPIPNAVYEATFGAGAQYPLLDRAIQGQYPPASTYKTWILLSALQRRVVTTADTYPCPPSWVVPGDTGVFRNWARYDMGNMTLATALSESCDTVFYPMGYEYWRRYYPPPSRDGIVGNDDDPAVEPLQKDLRAIGYGSVTGIDLPSEYSGRVPDAAWKLRIHERYPDDFPYGDWVPGDFINMSIGQGDTLVTPMQVAVSYAALMNDGLTCTPHLVAAVQDPAGGVVRTIQPRCEARLPFDSTYLAYVREALVDTVREGTASGAFVGFPFDRIAVAGKTGTAQVFGSQDYSWFAAMTSSGGERYVVVVVVEQGGHGSTTAAPIARRVIQGLYDGIASLGDVGFAVVGGTD